MIKNFSLQGRTFIASPATCIAFRSPLSAMKSIKFMLLSQLCLATAIPHSTPVESLENPGSNVPENHAGLESRAFDFLRDVIGVDIQKIVDTATGKSVAPATDNKVTLLSALGIHIPEIIGQSKQAIDAIEKSRQSQNDATATNGNTKDGGQFEQQAEATH